MAARRPCGPGRSTGQRIDQRCSSSLSGWAMRNVCSMSSGSYSPVSMNWWTSPALLRAVWAALITAPISRNCQPCAAFFPVLPGWMMARCASRRACMRVRGRSVMGVSGVAVLPVLAGGGVEAAVAVQAGGPRLPASLAAHLMGGHGVLDDHTARVIHGRAGEQPAEGFEVVEGVRFVDERPPGEAGAAGAALVVWGWFGVRRRTMRGHEGMVARGRVMFGWAPRIHP